MFVSSTTVGGSGRSQRELAKHLIGLGQEVDFLVEDENARRGLQWLYEQLSDASVRWHGRPTTSLISHLRDLPGRTTTSMVIDGLRHTTTPFPQNAIGRVIDRRQPDLVVGNSLDRWSWRRILDVCVDRGVPAILYVREDDSVDHLLGGHLPDAVVANAKSLCRAIRERGFDCTFVPSVVDVTATRTKSSRTAALAINPIQSRGVDIAVQIAERIPAMPVVLQESWALDDDQLAQIERDVGRLPNLTLRRAVPAGPRLYGDARLLLVPYRVDNRPRVILEAQANNIPVIAGDVPALIEAVGSGGRVVPLGDIDAWVSEIERVWYDATYYEKLCRLAGQHSRRPEVDPIRVAQAFLDVASGVVAANSC